MKKNDNDESKVKVCTVAMGGERAANNEMSIGEKNMCLQVLGTMPPLPFPTKLTLCDDGVTQTEYIIPENERQDVLNTLCFFCPIPSMDDVMFDLHEKKNFVVRNFRVIRWGGTNILASPYYPHSGGMLVDWVTPEQTDEEALVMKIDSKYTGNLNKMTDEK